MTTHSSLHLPFRLEVLVAADFAEVLLANKFSRLLLLSPEDDSVFSLSATRVKSVIPFCIRGRKYKSSKCLFSSIHATVAAEYGVFLVKLPLS